MVTENQHSRRASRDSRCSALLRLLIRNGNGADAASLYDSYEVEYLPNEGLLSTSRFLFIELTTDALGTSTGFAIRYQGEALRRRGLWRGSGLWRHVAVALVMFHHMIDISASSQKFPWPFQIRPSVCGAWSFGSRAARRADSFSSCFSTRLSSRPIKWDIYLEIQSG